MSNLVCQPLSAQASRMLARPGAGEEVYVGLDISRSKWVYCVRFGGQVRRRLSTPGELCHLQSLVAEYSSSKLHVVYEACGFGFEIAWWLQEQQVDVMVIAPSKVERAPGPRVKTDRLDAADLALKRERNQIKGIYIPSRATHENRQLVRTYQQALKDRRREQTRIRALLQEHGRLGPPPKAGWAPYRKWFENEKATLPPPVTTSVLALLSLREAADRCVKELRRQILRLHKGAEHTPITSALMNQAGIGAFTATVLVLELGSMARFRSGNALAHYLGLTPSEYTSGEVVRRGPILRCGPRTVRSLLLQCAWRSIRHDQGDPRLRAVYDRLQPDSKRGIIAVARRLAVSVYSRWKASELLQTC